MSACYLDWLTADLGRLVETATQCLALCDDPYAGEIEGYARYHLASASYQRNDLTMAEEQFRAVVQHPYLNYGMAFVDSAIGLSLTHQARGRTDEACNVAASAVSFLLETGNRTLLEEARAFQAELAWRQGRMAEAKQWLAQFDVLPPMAPMTRLYRWQFTPVKIWLSVDDPDSRRLAAERLGQLKEYAAYTRNTVASIEGLALQALLFASEGNETTALVVLKQALIFAQPGRFVRVFTDLGLPMARLLRRLTDDIIPTAYVAQILAAFPVSPVDHRGQYSPAMDKPLTQREAEVLSLLARRMTNKEIADTLVISPDTVKSHTLSIYAKLDVHGRRQAVARAQKLGLLFPA
jgi:LuxR family maltose regulon positive regulatory protein